MKGRLLLALGLGLAWCSASAQLLGLGVRAGYTFSGSFSKLSGGSATLQGPEVGVDFPIGPHIPIPGSGGVSFNFSPSIFFGGALDNSGVRDDVYRLVATATFTPPSSPAYFRIGVGYSDATAQDSAFNSGWAYEAQFLVGFPVIKLVTGAVNLELSYHASSMQEISGFTVGLSARF